jgi:RNA polymerase primary sigma factor
MTTTNAVLSRVDEILKRLIKKGRAQGSLTADEIIDAFPDDDDIVDDVYTRLVQAGIDIRSDEESEPLDAALKRRNAGGEAEVGEGDSISLYLREIGSIPLLTPDDEVDLARELELGAEAEAHLGLLGDSVGPAERGQLNGLVSRGREARQRLIQANSRLVVHIAKRYMGHGVQLQDLIQEGNLGLIRAVEKFDYRRGFKFSTYATWWIRQSIARALADQSRAVRVPVHMTERINRVVGARRRLEQRLGHEPSVVQLAAELATTPRQVEELLEIAQRPLSLEMPVGQERDSELGEFLEDSGVPPPPEIASRSLLREEIEQALSSLTPREARVLQMRYGLLDGTPHTLEEVGAKFGITRERVRQLEQKAIRRLRHPTRSRKLKEYLR